MKFYFSTFTHLVILPGILKILGIHHKVARKIPFEDPEVLKYARIGYVVTQLTILGIYYYVSMVVSRGFLPSIIWSALY